MSTYGAKASQKGYDVRTCADYQLVYSSEWPLLKIAFEGQVIIPDATLDVTIQVHNLGYVPAFWIFDNGSYLSYVPGSHLAYSGLSQYVTINGTDLKWSGASRGAPPGLVTLYFYIFRYDITSSYTADIFTTSPDVLGTDNDYGILVSKPGFDLRDTDFRNFTIRSDCRSPMIHKTGTGTFGPGGGNAVITHNLTYEPMYFFYANITLFGDNRWQMVQTAEDSYVEATATTATFNLGQQCTYSYMIFKDPVLLN